MMYGLINAKNIPRLSVREKSETTPQTAFYGRLASHPSVADFLRNETHSYYELQL